MSDPLIGEIARSHIVRNPAALRALVNVPEGRKQLTKHWMIAEDVLATSDDPELLAYAGWMLYQIGQAMEEHTRGRNG